MGAIVAWLARWGRVLAGYVAYVAAFALIVSALNQLLGVSIQAVIDPSRLWSTFMGYIDALLGHLADLISGSRNEDTVRLLLYCAGFDGLVDILSICVGVFTVVLSTIVQLATYMFLALSYQWACRKVKWLGNAVAGVGVGDHMS